MRGKAVCPPSWTQMCKWWVVGEGGRPSKRTPRSREEYRARTYESSGSAVRGERKMTYRFPSGRSLLNMMVPQILGTTYIDSKIQLSYIVILTGWNVEYSLALLQNLIKHGLVSSGMGLFMILSNSRPFSCIILLVAKVAKVHTNSVQCEAER